MQWPWSKKQAQPASALASALASAPTPAPSVSAHNSAAPVEVINASSTPRRARKSLDRLGVSHDGKRDLNVVYGHTNKGRKYKDYYERYRLTGVGFRIVTAPARSCWRAGATITAPESDTELLAKEMQELTELGLFRNIQQADVLNRIGRYSVLFVGMPGETDFTQPVESKGGNLSDVYFSPYSEDAIQVSERDKEKTSPRYGLPIMYTLLPNQGGEQESNALPDTRQSFKVHYTRIVHLAEGALDNSLVGISSLDPVFNDIDDLIKTTGGGAEAHWRNAFQKLVIDIDDSAKFDENDIPVIETSAEEFINEAKSVLVVQGGDAKALPVEIASPVPAAEVIIDNISMGTSIPQRILTGKGGGHLLGNEDKAAWNELISDRQKDSCASWLADLLRILNSAGLIKLPDVFVVKWPLPTAMDEKTAAEVRLADAQAAEARAKAIAIVSTTDTVKPEQQTAMVDALIDALTPEGK